MKEFKKGMLARSKAGHDTGRLYVLLEADEEYVYLTDGDLRPLEKPKKKKRKHIQIIYAIPDCLKDCSEGQLRDEHIRRAIKEYKNPEYKNPQEV